MFKINLAFKTRSVLSNGCSPTSNCSFFWVNGFLDDVNLNKIKDLEKKIYEEIKTNNPEIIDNINNTGKLDEDTEKQLMSLIGDFKKKINK